MKINCKFIVNYGVIMIYIYIYMAAWEFRTNGHTHIVSYTPLTMILRFFFWVKKCTLFFVRMEKYIIFFWPKKGKKIDGKRFP